VRNIRFGCFDVDLATGRLFKSGMRVRLPQKSFRLLASLLEDAGHVVTRQELQRRLWTPDVFVDFENNLNTAIGRLREALGDCADHPRFIETLPKFGYRFIGIISDPQASPPPAASPRRKRRVPAPGAQDPHPRSEAAHVGEQRRRAATGGPITGPARSGPWWLGLGGALVTGIALAVLVSALGRRPVSSANQVKSAQAPSSQRFRL
jgi:DNA-binding winged helix-turn-helix (wHTH) protein